jgi:hypothetical protein
MAYQTSSGNYFTVPRNYNVANLSIAFWVYRTGSGTAAGLWEDSGSVYQWLISFSGSGGGTVAFYTTTSQVTAPIGTPITANTWIHFCITRDGSASKIFVNGAENRSVAFTGTLASRTASFGIGARQAGSDAFGGYLAEFATWTRALSAAEIASLADGFKASRIPTPDIYFPLVREKIDVRNKYTLTTVGSPSVQAHTRIY